MTTHGAPPHPALGVYLAALAAALLGPRRRRTAVINEVADGLSEALEQHRARGLTSSQAEQAAIEEFGPPERLAAGFTDELIVAHARQTVAVLLLTGPLVGIWWLLLLAPTSWWRDPLSLWGSIPVVPLVGVVVLIGLTVIATTGNLARWLPETPPRRALTLAIRLGQACVGVDLALLLIAGMRALVDQPAWAPVLVIAAIAASGLRMALTIAATFRMRRNSRPAHPGRTARGRPGHAAAG